MLAVLIASGYLLYYAGGERRARSVSVMHWAIGLAVPLPFLVHRLAKPVPLQSQLRAGDGETEGLV